MTNGFLDLPVTTIDGRETTLNQYKGKALLVVNVASKCGFTKQYAGLEKIHEQYADRGFSVLGFPCNQFGGQEPGTDVVARLGASTRPEDPGLIEAIEALLPG